MVRNLCKEILDKGGKILPLIVPPDQTKGTTLMNPCVYHDKGKIIVNIRHVNYVLYHCEGEERFYHRYGPLVYLNPENDITLTTTNYIVVLNDDFAIEKCIKVDTSKLDKKPLWEFIGLEDVRLVRWKNKLYQSGVRRDTTRDGQGRIELSEIKTTEDTIKEISRVRLDIPQGEKSYCEKNWMPILDKPFHYVKWCNPTQVIQVDPKSGVSWTEYVGTHTIPNLPDLRGGSQVVKWKNHYIAIVHQVNLFKSKTGQKDADYSQRMIVWDMDWNILSITEPFKFMDGDIEFCCGMDLYKGNLLISYGFQDNASYLVSIPEEHIESIFRLEYLDFEWGPFKRDTEFLNNVRTELFKNKVYDIMFQVEKGDFVVDIGASVGPFAYSIMGKNPSKVICLEPQKDLYNVAVHNLSKFDNVVVLNKGITTVNGKTKFDNMFKPAEEGPGWWKQTEGIGITLQSLIDEYEIKKIDFLKIDCEGGEYDFFSAKNYDWIKKNVKKISAEFHVFDKKTKKQFLKFRDKYLKGHTNYKALSYDGTNDISEAVLEDNFVDKWLYFMLYIDNR